MEAVTCLPARMVLDLWSGLPFPSPGDLPNPGIKPGSPALQADSLPSEPPRYFILSDAVVSGIVSLISVSESLLSVYRSATNTGQNGHHQKVRLP